MMFKLPSLFCLSLQLESNEHLSLQHCIIIATPSGGLNQILSVFFIVVL